MTEPNSVGAMLRVLHSDVLLPGDSSDNGEAMGDEQASTLPPTRTEETSRFRLEDMCTIGRNPSCTIRVRRERTDISRLHATIVRDGERYRLDNHSSRGTFVNQQRVDGSVILDSGDILGFGESARMLRFIAPTALARLLTLRERDVLGHMMQGRTNKEIGSVLHISPDTVNTHVQRIFEKLGVHSRTEAVVLAQTKGLLHEQPGSQDGG
jgi:DNA-binding CsgD family transcriptional regulator